MLGVGGSMGKGLEMSKTIEQRENEDMGDGR